MNEAMAAGSFATKYPEREAYFITIAPDTPRLKVCSDERGFNPQSLARLQQALGYNPDSAALRDFGGIRGDAHDRAAATAAMYGTAAIEQFAGDLNNLTIDTKKAVAKALVGMITLVDHSDDRNDDSQALNMEAKNGLGCAFDRLFGGVMKLEATDKNVQQLAREEFIRDVNEDTAKFDNALQGITAAFDVICEGDEDYGLDRTDVITTADQDSEGKPLIAILTGGHAPVDDALEVANYVPNSSAKRDGRTFVTDMTDTTLELILACRGNGIDLDPEIVFAVKIIKRAAVRCALAAGDAGAMQTTTRGDGHAALTYIRAQLNRAA